MDISLYMMYVIFALLTHIVDISKTDKILQFLANSPDFFRQQVHMYEDRTALKCARKI